jgi:hypothetical protein
MVRVIQWGTVAGLTGLVAAFWAGRALSSRRWVQGAVASLLVLAAAFIPNPLIWFLLAAGIAAGWHLKELAAPD